MLPFDIFAMACSINGVAAQAHRREPRVIVEHINPPIPAQTHDYRATLEDYDEGGPMGWGATPEAATADLLNAIEIRIATHNGLTLGTDGGDGGEGRA